MDERESGLRHKGNEGMSHVNILDEGHSRESWKCNRPMVGTANHVSSSQVSGGVQVKVILLCFIPQ